MDEEFWLRKFKKDTLQGSPRYVEAHLRNLRPPIPRNMMEELMNSPIQQEERRLKELRKAKESKEVNSNG